MKTAEQGEIVERIAADRVVPIDPGVNRVVRAENVPEGQVFVNQATFGKREQRLLPADLGAHRGGGRRVKKLPFDEKAEMPR